ncbi:MAG: hypothetical protein OXR62_08375 [Ahrensia sp.]|nr:hypothetical protein [Ahrensia sp.]
MAGKQKQRQSAPSVTVKAPPVEPAHAGTFIVSGEGDKINFQLVGDAPTDKESALFVRMDRLHTRINALFVNDQRKRYEYCGALRSLAQTVFSREATLLELGNIGIDQLVNDIVTREGWRIKLDYLKKLGEWIAVSVVFAMLIYLILEHWASFSAANTDRLQAFVVLYIGSQLGVFLSFGSRRTSFGLEELLEVAATNSEPVVRLVYTGMLAIAFGLIVSQGLLVLQFGSFNAKDFVDGFESALLVGLIMGLIEKTLSLRLGNEIATMGKVPTAA